MPGFAAAPATTWWTLGGIAVVLVGLHVAATHGSFTLSQATLDRIGITPRTTLSHAHRHLWAGLFHKSIGHIAFNLALFALAFPVAAGVQPFRTGAAAYIIGPLTVLFLHLVLVRPMAAAGNAYGEAALDVGLVGFSVIAYALAGMAVVEVARWRPALAFAIVCAVVALELVVGVVLAATTPFVWVYHLAGFAVGAGVRAAEHAGVGRVLLAAGP